jgi:hypothetical protein
MLVVVQEERTSRATVDAQARRSDFMGGSFFLDPAGTSRSGGLDIQETLIDRGVASPGKMRVGLVQGTR